MVKDNVSWIRECASLEVLKVKLNHEYGEDILEVPPEENVTVHPYRIRDLMQDVGLWRWGSIEDEYWVIWQWWR